VTGQIVDTRTPATIQAVKFSSSHRAAGKVTWHQVVQFTARCLTNSPAGLLPRSWDQHSCNVFSE